jgi:hypothetical protein
VEKDRRALCSRRPPCAREQLDEEYGYAELLIRESESGGEWHKRAAALTCIIEGVVQAGAAEAARDN